MMEPHFPANEASRQPLPPGLIHDLRTPLNQIIGYTEMLIEQAQEQRQEEFVPDLQKTRAAGRQLLALFDEHFHPIRAAEPPAAAAEPTGQETGAEGSPDSSAAAQGFLLVVDD